MLLTSFTTGPSFLLVLALLLDDRLSDSALQGGELAEQRVDVLRGCNRDAAAETGPHLHVVDGQHVGGIGHREQQGSLVDEPDRHGPVATSRLDRDQVGRRHVDLVDREVDVVEPVSVGGRS
jgi:hypothetical protein